MTMNQKLTVVKVSGKIVENPDALKTFVKRFAALGGARVLIYSGANLAEAVGERMGINTKKVNDRPVRWVLPVPT